MFGLQTSQASKHMVSEKRDNQAARCSGRCRVPGQDPEIAVLVREMNVVGTEGTLPLRVLDDRMATFAHHQVSAVVDDRATVRVLGRQLGQ